LDVIYLATCGDDLGVILTNRCVRQPNFIVCWLQYQCFQRGRAGRTSKGAAIDIRE
jgi:hypothetical protein